jgi:hypothetical protein
MALFDHHADRLLRDQEQTTNLFQRVNKKKTCSSPK